MFRRISHLSEREELRLVLDTLSTLSRASLRYFSALSYWPELKAVTLSLRRTNGSLGATYSA